MTGIHSETPGTKGEQTRSAILEAAIERFGREGYRATSVADIARDAGVSGTAAYAYFTNKEDLFLAALDTDAAAVINEGLFSIEDSPITSKWRQGLIVTLIDAVGQHPLAARVLSGLEPPVTDRVVEIPAMTALRETVARRIRDDQSAGLVRPDIDPTSIANGAVALIVSVLMAALQFGGEGIELYQNDVIAVFDAALDPVPPV